MRSVTVTIGRNVGAEPLSADDWQAFTSATRDAVDGASGGETWAWGEYVGGWNGVREDAYFILSPVGSAASVEILRRRLAVLATRYGQDAIGLSVGDAELVESLAPTAVAARSESAS